MGWPHDMTISMIAPTPELTSVVGPDRTSSHVSFVVAGKA